MEKYFPFDTSKCGQKLETIVKFCRVAIFASNVANTPKGNEWLAKIGALKLKTLIAYVLNK